LQTCPDHIAAAGRDLEVLSDGKTLPRATSGQRPGCGPG